MILANSQDNQKKIEIVKGDGKLNISNVGEHLNITKEQIKKRPKKNTIQIPKEKK